MRTVFGFTAAALAVLARGSVAQAQYFHGHAHYHRGHIDYHGHWHYPSYYSYSGYPVIYGSSGYAPTYGYPSVVTSPPTVIYPSSVRLPADLPGPVYMRVDKRDIELKPGTEVTLKEKASCVVEFDRGGDFGAARQELTEGRYKLAVGEKGCQIVPDTAGGLRPNPIPLPVPPEK